MPGELRCHQTDKEYVQGNSRESSEVEEYKQNHGHWSNSCKRLEDSAKGIAMVLLMAGNLDFIYFGIFVMLKKMGG
ncbi:hypothetical protein BGZ79_002216 [Entomortierella chlamydospora]|nr:hypothetical protein BGZ79_002216 [Entomortierella chlamydospora]